MERYLLSSDNNAKKKYPHIKYKHLTILCCSSSLKGILMKRKPYNDLRN